MKRRCTGISTRRFLQKQMFLQKNGKKSSQYLFHKSEFMRYACCLYRFSVVRICVYTLSEFKRKTKIRIIIHKWQKFRSKKKEISFDCFFILLFPYYDSNNDIKKNGNEKAALTFSAFYTSHIPCSEV